MTANKDDAGKPRMDRIPPEVFRALGVILGHGAIEHGERNWEQGFEYGRIFAALQRHLWDFWDCIDFDAKSGLPHLYHALANVAFLIAHTERKIGHDDRKN